MGFIISGISIAWSLSKAMIVLSLIEAFVIAYVLKLKESDCPFFKFYYIVFISANTISAAIAVGIALALGFKDYKILLIILYLVAIIIAWLFKSKKTYRLFQHKCIDRKYSIITFISTCSVFILYAVYMFL